MALIWTEGAIADLEHIRRYLGAVGHEAEIRLAWATIGAARRLDALGDHPAGCHDIALLRPFALRVHGAGPTGFVLSVRQQGGAIR